MSADAGSLVLHRRIAAEVVRRAIAPGCDPKLPLPSEEEIQRDYGVSRATARQALAELRRAGVIVTIPEQGSFLARLGPDPSTPQ